ncbi:MAG: DUF551 domain-containing protein [Acidobacteria bacterium]|nr:DUF551 domain-containing protein [Acidobacteriota bacterium]
MTWVSITDRLPDRDCAALVTDGRHVTLADWTERDGWVLDRGDKAFGITATALTHWMPLPAPPTQVQREVCDTP